MGLEEEEDSRDILAEEEKRRKKKKQKRKLKEAMVEAMNVDEEQGNEMLEEDDEIKFKVEILGEQPDKISPIVGYFPSGFDPLKEQQQQHRPTPEIRVFRNTKRTQRLQLVVSPNDSQVDFIGNSHSSEIAAAGSQCNYALGVLDKETGTLKIVPIASNKIYRLEPKIQGVDESDKGSAAKEELTEDQKADIKRDRLLMYETKRAINKAKKAEALYKKDDPTTQENMEVKLKKIKINKEVLESAGSHNSRNIPFHDVNATTPDSAFPLDKIISNSDWDFLVDVLEYIQTGEDLTQYPSFVRNRAHKLASIKDDFEKSKIAGLFSYITHLIKFKDKHSIEGSSSAKNHIIPAKIYQRFSSLFAESNSKRLLDEKRNLLISHVLVLTLFADDFKSDMADIAKDLRMTAVELRRHFENLGCKLKREGTALWATLPVPLSFPKIKGKRRNK